MRLISKVNWDFLKRLLSFEGLLAEKMDRWIKLAQPIHHKEQFTNDTERFWTSQSAFIVYGLMSLAILTRQPRILHGISVVLVRNILWTTLKWVLFILDDRELWEAIQFAKGWLAIIVREGEKAIDSHESYKYFFAYTVVQNASTGVDYFRAILRYKTKLIRNEIIQEMVDDRYPTIQE